MPPEDEEIPEELHRLIRSVERLSHAVDRLVDLLEHERPPPLGTFFQPLSIKVTL